MKHGQALLSTAYFPPIQYITKFLIYSDIKIEKFENYNKQSYRNRCIILSANGPLNLFIPVQKNNHPKNPISEIRLDYNTNWQKNHWKALRTAYKRSPFFEFYIDDLEPFFHQKFEFLLPYNSAILEVLFSRIGIEYEIIYSGSYFAFPTECSDYRNTIHPKLTKSLVDVQFEQASYNQVFLSKFGFVAGLSVLDLLFNEGPNSLSVLKNSITA